MTKRTMVQVHVTPLGLLWQIKVDGKRIGTYTTQASADIIASHLARRMAPASLKLHGRKSRIRTEKTYSRADDPPETPG